MQARGKMISCYFALPLFNLLKVTFDDKKPVTALLDDAVVTQFINDLSCHGRVCITLFNKNGHFIL